MHFPRDKSNAMAYFADEGHEKDLWMPVKYFGCYFGVNNDFLKFKVNTLEDASGHMLRTSIDLLFLGLNSCFWTDHIFFD